MNFIDTHTHIYLEEFDADRPEAIERARQAGIAKLLLPNIDSASWEPMLKLSDAYPGYCLPMAGLHPTSVKPETAEAELLQVEQQLQTGKFIAVGEIGIDLYWDRTHQGLQEDVFRAQLQLAKKHRLPVAIHVRNSYNEVWRILKHELSPELKGVFHCFPGNEIQARQVIEAGFMLGTGGVVTYKKSTMQEVVQAVGIQHIILETDSPFLSPVPHRGKRNEPSYIPLIAERVAELCGLNTAEVAEATTRNALEIFNLSGKI